MDTTEEGKHMDIKTKAKIVGEAWLSTRGVEQWASVHHYLDIGFPLAFAASNGFATLTKKGEGIVDEAYSVIIKSLSLDLYKDYESFEDLLDENIMNNVEKD
jgi:hypothetical protein